MAINRERRDVVEKINCTVGGFDLNLTGVLDSDIKYIGEAFSSRVNEFVQEIKYNNSDASISTKEEDIWVEEFCFGVNFEIKRQESDSEYSARIAREERNEKIRLTKELNQRTIDIKVLAELTKKLGVEVVGGIPAVPEIPKEKKKIVKKRERGLPR